MRGLGSRSHKLRVDLRSDFLKCQGGRCAICRAKNPHLGFHLDHDHDTGGFRGALCWSCNTALGHLCESPELLKRAIAYLKLPRIARFPRTATQSENGKVRALANHKKFLERRLAA